MYTSCQTFRIFILTFSDIEQVTDSALIYYLIVSINAVYAITLKIISIKR